MAPMCKLAVEGRAMTAKAPLVDVALAAPHERTALDNMFQLYVHDFSEQWADRPGWGEFDENGLFGPYPDMESYWREPDRIPLLLRKGGRLVGFALLDTGSHTGAELDRNMAEFFIARKYRRGGVGTAAVHAIFDRFPGRWEAAVARRNVGALAFWRRAVASHPQLEWLKEADVDSPAWNGPVLVFKIREPEAEPSA
jgi:predicted acetyltransferase